MKKEKVYDFGMFGKWSKDTLKGNVLFNLDDKVYVPSSSPLGITIARLKPEFKAHKEFSKQWFKKTMFGRIVVNNSYWETEEDFTRALLDYVEERIHEKASSQKYWEDRRLVELTIRKEFETPNKNK